MDKKSNFQSVYLLFITWLKIGKETDNKMILNYFYFTNLYVIDIEPNILHEI